MEIASTLDGFAEVCDFKLAEEVLASINPSVARDMLADKYKEQFDKIVIEMVREANFLEYNSLKESLQGTSFLLFHVQSGSVIMTYRCEATCANWPRAAPAPIQL